LSWRDEIDIVLQDWIAALGGGQGEQRWRRVGVARPTAEPGVYVVDIRATNLNADQSDNLRLAGPENRNVEAGFPVMQATFEGELVRLRVAEFADLAEPYLWQLRQEPAFLITNLREKFRELKDAGLANLLAQGEVGGALGAVDTPPGWKLGQQEAYRACLGTGVWLVWGPPGTGKTRVIRGAVGDLLAAGQRVLLVSGTNIAVDNALAGVLRERRHQPGDIVRVGPAHLPEIINNPEVSVPLIVKARLAEVEEQRRAVAEDLLRMNRHQERLRALGKQLEGFDADRYDAAATLLATPGKSVAEVDGALARYELQAGKGLQTISTARNQLEAAEQVAAEADPFRPQWAGIADMEAELAIVAEAAQKSARRALVAKKSFNDAEDTITELSQPDGKVRWRDRRAFKDAQERYDTARKIFEPLRAAAAEARTTANDFRREIESAIARLSVSSPLSRDEIRRRDTAAEQAGARVRAFEEVQFSTLNRLTELRAAHADAVAAAELITACMRRRWPDLHAEATALRSDIKRDEAMRHSLEERHAALQGQYERLAKGTESEIIKAARLVATTLARFRLVKAVFDGQYDVVIIDEVGAATLPEVLLAVAKAAKCAVLLGDFMQLGPILPRSLTGSDRSDIRRWLVTDPFRHCGITTLPEAVRHPSCLVLDTQHRFGPNVMRLANLLAYDGLLKAGDNIRVHDASDPEIVLVDTDGLNELADVRRTGSSSGWWAAGLLLSRALVELHDENGETSGIVTPYIVQAEATKEALRDVEPNGRPLAEVGTAHRFQGREFPVVVFDTVESRDNGNMWIGQASRLPGSGPWQQQGVRLFNVAATRVQHRLYVIASRDRVWKAKPGTALGHLGTLLRDRQVRDLSATRLITPTTWEPADLGAEGTRLADVLARHVTITDIHDERSFYEQFAVLISQAQSSIWLWSAWVASRVRTVLPLLRDAVDRGVRVTVFVRDPSDALQQKRHFAEALASLRAVVPNVVEVHTTHEKIVVIDDHTVMLGSLNALSQQRSREVMITMTGQHWARRLLTDLHAEEFSRPPRCGACKGQQVDLRRATDSGSWYWRCYNPACPDRGKGRYKAWTRTVILRPPRY
jgi:AAA domain/PLD-like domain